MSSGDQWKDARARNYILLLLADLQSSHGELFPPGVQHRLRRLKAQSIPVKLHQTTPPGEAEY